MNIMKKKIQVDKNERKYILFRIDVYFDEFLLAVEIDEKGHTDRDPTFEKKKKKEALEKKLGCKFFRINTSNAQNTYDLDYEVSDIEAIIDEFNKKNKRTGKQNKRKRRRIKQKNKRTRRQNKRRTKEQVCQRVIKLCVKYFYVRKTQQIFVKKILPTL